MSAGPDPVEIRNGILWPTGVVDWSSETGWSNLTTLLRAGIAGARAGNPTGHRLLVMLHFDGGGNNADSVRFFDHVPQRPALDPAPGARQARMGLFYREPEWIPGVG